MSKIFIDESSEDNSIYSNTIINIDSSDTDTLSTSTEEYDNTTFNFTIIKNNITLDKYVKLTINIPQKYINNKHNTHKINIKLTKKIIKLLYNKTHS